MKILASTVLVVYLIFTTVCAGYLNSFNSFLDPPWKMSKANIAGRSVIWPWTLGEIMCGIYMGELVLEKMLEDAKSKPEVETEEEFEVPEDPDEIKPGVIEGSVRA